MDSWCRQSHHGCIHRNTQSPSENQSPTIAADHLFGKDATPAWEVWTCERRAKKKTAAIQPGRIAAAEDLRQSLGGIDDTGDKRFRMDRSRFVVDPVEAAWRRCFNMHFIDLVASLAEQTFFFFLDNDSRRDHHHQAFRFTSNPAVLEQSADVRNLVQDWNTGHRSSFLQSFDSTEEHRTTIGYADRRTERHDFRDRLLDGDDRAAALLTLLATCLSSLAASLTTLLTTRLTTGRACRLREQSVHDLHAAQSTADTNLATTTGLTTTAAELAAAEATLAPALLTTRLGTTTATGTCSRCLVGEYVSDAGEDWCERQSDISTVSGNDCRGVQTNPPSLTVVTTGV